MKTLIHTHPEISEYAHDLEARHGTIGNISQGQEIPGGKRAKINIINIALK